MADRKTMDADQFLKYLAECSNNLSCKERAPIDISSENAEEGKCLVIEDVDVIAPISIVKISDFFDKKERPKIEWDTLLFKNCCFLSFNTGGHWPSGVRPNLPQLGFDNCEIDFLSFQGGRIESFCLCNKTNVRHFAISDLDRTSIYIHDCSFQQISSPSRDIVSTGFIDFIDVNFLGVCFFKSISFKGNLLFRECCFSIAPSFVNSNLSPETEFVDCEFRDYSQTSVICYRYLKRAFRNHANDHMADLFSSHEMQARAESENLEMTERFISKCYNCFSSYGRNFVNPILLYFCLFFLSWDIYLVSEIFLQNVLISNVQENTSGLILEFVKEENMVILISAMVLKLWLGPFGLLINLSGIEFSGIIYAVLGWFIQLTSSIMLFLIILTIRRRFRLN